MFKRFIRFMLMANGITPAGHKEPDKWAKVRQERERWEREQRGPKNADEPRIAAGATRGTNADSPASHSGMGG